MMRFDTSSLSKKCRPALSSSTSALLVFFGGGTLCAYGCNGAPPRGELEYGDGDELPEVVGFWGVSGGADIAAVSTRVPGNLPEKRKQQYAALSEPQNRYGK